MKQLTLRHLKIDREGTELIRTALRKKGRITITVNLDAADLRAAKTRSKQAGIPYSTHSEDASLYDGVPTRVDSVPSDTT